MLFLLAGCTRAPESRPVAPAPARTSSAAPAPFWSNVEDASLSSLRSPLDSPDRRWLNKAVRFLRGGEGLRAGENAEELLQLSKEQVIDRLSNDPRFGNLALDFNMYFLGFKQGAIRQRGAYSRAIYQFPSAIESAREVLKNGDYLRLLDLYVPAYVPSLAVVNPRDDEKNLAPLALYWKRVNEIQGGLQAVIDFAKNDPSASVDSVCSRFRSEYNNGEKFFGLGMPFNLLLIGLTVDENWYFDAFNVCTIGKKVEMPELIQALERAQNTSKVFFRAFATFYDPAHPPAQTVAELRPFDTAAAGITLPWLSWDLNQRNNLKNSSTNSNRKRGAYVLKRFFCDDLTPIGVESPAEHTGGRHGTDVSCRSCHYKLDPISGFFRNFGVLFRDFSQSSTITFDDLAAAPKESYFEQWRAPERSGREWNVGYVRSVKDETINDYGSSLSDLHTLFRKAPEVKRCLVKRAFEYAVGEDQTMDPGYLGQISEEFEKKAAVNSTQAFRWLMKQVLLSRTFVEPDPSPTECYDRTAGVDPTSTPPCRVQALLKNNCKSCHDGASGRGSLDLMGWVKGPDGVKNFPHLGFDGKQLPAKETLQTILDRLSTTDTEERMPYRKYMSAQDRQALYLWAQEELEKAKGTP